MAVGAIALLVLSCGDGAVEPAPPPAPVATTVTVSPGSATLTALGETARFTAEVRDQNGQVMAGAAVAWASNDASVASVDASGLVTAVGNGTATITATAGSASGAAMVTVAQSVDSIVVKPAAARVASGDTLRLTAEAFDENGHAVEGAEFSWTSSNASVASVDGSGLVRGVGDGAATIMAAAGSAVGTSEITVENPERAALVAFYEGTNGDFYWDDDTNWLSDQPVGTWFGITTDDEGRVVELAMPSNGVWGPIPPEFGQLQKLKRLDLGSNRVEGDLPSEIGNLPDLAELNLSEDAFLGSDTSIPAALGNLGKLEWLALSGTSFEGPIPRELGNLENLVRLDLADMVWLSGSIPPEFGQLVNLRRLDVANSIGLEGALPRELVNVPLDFFHWHRTRLCSPGDEEFRRWLRGIANHRTGVWGACDGEGGIICNSWDRLALAALHRSTGGVYWDTDDNWLSEQPLDSWHGVAVDDDGRVVELSLSDNGLRNAFSGHVLCLEKLKRLDLSGNRLTGVLGSRIGDLPDLEYLDLSDNPLLGYTGGPFLQHGTIHPIPAALGNLGKLEWLDLSGTSFGEAIPRELGSLSSLIRLDLSDMTWLTGPIPSEFGQLSHLRHLDVSDSPRMDGALPQELINVPLDLFYWNHTRLCSPPTRSLRRGFAASPIIGEERPAGQQVPYSGAMSRFGRDSVRSPGPSPATGRCAQLLDLCNATTPTEPARAVGSRRHQGDGHPGFRHTHRAGRRARRSAGGFRAPRRGDGDEPRARLIRRTRVPDHRLDRRLEAIPVPTASTWDCSTDADESPAPGARTIHRLSVHPAVSASRGTCDDSPSPSSPSPEIP